MTTTPTATEVKRLRDRYDASWKVAAVYFDAYNTAKATAEAASDTGRILDEAIAARQAACDAYRATDSTHSRAFNAATRAIDARDAAKRENDVARVAYTDAFTAVTAARKAHEATR
jgi:5-carboxymethyl-2-hydroxymuconate isomerase